MNVRKTHAKGAVLCNSRYQNVKHYKTLCGTSSTRHVYATFETHNVTCKVCLRALAKQLNTPE